MERSKVIDRFFFVMNEVYLILGSNIGDRLSYLERATHLLAENAGEILQSSSYYSTEPWGVEDQDFFINQVVLIRTSLSPEKLLQVILNIEKKVGRTEGEKYGPRVIDIDILLYNDLILQRPFLQIPHPLMQERNFVLSPLSEIAGNINHPVSQVSISTLLNRCRDQKEVFILAANEPANTI